jgi:hypothetical protein
MVRSCRKDAKGKEVTRFINGSHLPLDQQEDRRIDGKMM